METNPPPVPAAPADEPAPGSPASRVSRPTLVLRNAAAATSAPVTTAPAPSTPPAAPTHPLSDTPAPAEPDAGYVPHTPAPAREKPLPLRLRRPTPGRVKAVVGCALVFSLLAAALWLRFEWVVASPVVALAAFYVWQCVSLLLRYRRAVAHEREQHRPVSD